MTRPREDRSHISQLPYLPGLDGLRAIAVVAVMIYHANVRWLSGGFLGVEVFFVISGYLITLLLVAEHERSRRVSLGSFWMRRAKRLLPALFVLLALLVVYTAFFRSDELGKLRGDTIASLFYGMNWFQIWSDAGYTAADDFAPLRHLWSLAVEEQFYLLWPLIMAALLVRKGSRIASAAGWFVLVALIVTVVMGVLYHPGQIETAGASPSAYWEIGGRHIDKTNALYLSTITRSGGLLLGAAFALVWRPKALMRGPMRDKGPLLDLLAVLGLIGLVMLSWSLYIIGDDLRADPFLFRGGFLLTGLCTLLVLAAVTHQRALTGKVLGNPVFLWIGTRSYGLYLFHWPIYQIIRGQAGAELTLGEFAGAMVATAVVTESSYRLVEMPIRNGQAARAWQRMRSQRNPTPRRVFASASAALAAVMVFAGVNLATAEVVPNETEQQAAEAEEHLFDPFEDAGPTDPGGPGPEGDESDPDDAGGATETTTTEPEVTPGSDAPVTTRDDDDDGGDDGNGNGNGQNPGGHGSQNPSQGNQNSEPGQGGGRGGATTNPPNVVDRYAVGDSVMRGAAPALSAYGFEVDAEESRSFQTGLDRVRYLAESNRLGDIVVVHLGYNDSTITAERLDGMMQLLADVDQVLVLTIRLDRDFVYPLNDEIRRLPNRHDNVRVLDWVEVGNECPGACFYRDNFHLDSDGQTYYADQIVDALGIGAGAG